ncbi:PAS domain-containing sensor histidine kinase [Paenibacillus piri]|nr:PAS domain-containing sensor histidine kinase [Paenibacillus piri]
MRKTIFVNKGLARKHVLKYRSAIDPAIIFPESIIEESQLGVYFFRNGRLIYSNPRLAELLGYTREELLQTDLKHLIHPDDYGTVMKLARERLKGEKQTKRSRIRCIRKDGSVYRYEISGFKVEYKGKPAIMGTVIDASSQAQSEELLHENDLRYQRLIKYLPEPICVHDGTNLIYLNNAALKLFGAAQVEQLQPKTYLELIHPDYRPVISERIRKVLNSDEPLDFIGCRLMGLDERIIDVEVSSVRIHHFLGRQMVIQSVFRDITERKRAEEAIIKSEKLSVAGQMAAGIAHEIRNPLTSLKGFTQLLKTKISGSHEYLDIMLGELDRINEIVEEFMTFAKPKEHQFAYGDLTHILSGIVTLLETQAILNNVQIHADFDPDVPQIYCDANQLKQVFINIMKNALEAMPQGGEVRVELSRSGPAAVLVRIVDHGAGIPAEQLEQIGHPFFTTKSSGTGLGLMISFRIIEAHKGKMQFFSEPGKGTEVSITLPVSFAKRTVNQGNS